MLAEFRTYIISDPTVGGLIGPRMYPMTLPQKPQFPAVTYQVISALRKPTMLHEDNLPLTRIQIDSWALTMYDAVQVDEAIRSLFHNYTRIEMGGSGSPGVLVAGVFVEDHRTDYEPDTLLYRVSRDYKVFHRED